MATDDVGALLVYSIGKKHLTLQPPSWRYRPRWILAGAAPRLYCMGCGRGHAGITSARPTKTRVFEHQGAEWLLRRRVEEETRDAFSLSTYIPFKVKCALLDERQEETQGGLTGRKDGINRGPKTAGLCPSAWAPDVDNGAYPLMRHSFDPLISAALDQMTGRVQAAQRAGSKPTARMLLKAAPHELADWRMDEPSYWREPKGGVYLTPWHWKPNGPVALYNTVGRPGGWPRSVVSEFESWPASPWTILDQADFADRAPLAVNRAAWSPGASSLAPSVARAAIADERVLRVVTAAAPLRFEGRWHLGALPEVAGSGLLPWTAAQRAAAATGEGVDMLV